MPPMIVSISLVCTILLSLFIVMMNVRATPYLMLLIAAIGIDTYVISYFLDNTIFDKLPIEPSLTIAIVLMVGVIGAVLTIYSFYKVIKTFQDKTC